MSQSVASVLTESNLKLSPSILIDTMVNNKTMEVEKDKESLNNEEHKLKSDGGLLSGIENFISMFSFFLKL